MAAPIGFRLTKRPLDQWSTKEKLSLASSVKRSGDQNWVSVSRAIKPFAEENRPSDWFSQKNCALQYADLLEKAETPKRKRGEKNEREVSETPAIQIVRKLTIERIEELKQFIQEQQSEYKQLKAEVDSVRSGECDDKLTEIWDNIQREKKEEEERKEVERQKAEEEAAERAKLHAMRKVTGIQKTNTTSSSVGSFSEVDESTQDSIPEHLNVETTDDELPPTSSVAPVRPISIEIPAAQGAGMVDPMKPIPPTSPVLSSLLRSKQINVDSLQQIKDEAEAEHALKQTQVANQIEAVMQLTNQQSEQSVSDKNTDGPSIGTLLDATASLQTKTETGDHSHDLSQGVPPDMSQGVSHDMSHGVSHGVSHDLMHGVPPDMSHDLPEVKTEVDIETTEQIIEIDTSHIKEEIIECEHIIVEETVEVMTHESPVKEPTPVKKIEQPEPVPLPVEDVEISEVSVGASFVPSFVSSFVPLEDEVLRDEPPSPASSISSRISETGSKSSSRKSKGGRTSAGSRRSSSRVTRRSNADDLSSRPSDGETSDDDSSVANLGQSGISAFSESVPNSPLSHCSDTEDDKAYKTWKKSIMLVWRAAANHKYANVFLHHVTDDIAPGYSTVVRRPKDLTIIKRHIENGTIRTTAEFQRDMMLMFTNAIMYNSSNHDVYKMGEEMYNDTMEQIEAYVSTQIMVQNSEAKMLRPTRRNESSDKEDESRRRRTSSEAEGGKTKKRKTRTEDT